jgi:LysR family cyn operon transcriptional activator
MLLRHARYLVAIADHGSFTRAAAELHVSQPALSQQIRQLEEMLGARLLDRTGRIVRPTDAGRAYIDHARRALREFEAGRRAIHDVETLDSGALRLAFTPTFTTYLVGPLVRQFHGRHPGIGISVDVLAQTEMETALSEDRIDLGVAFGTVQSDDIVARPLYEERLCLVVGEGHSAFDHAELAASGLDGMDLALLDTTFVTRAAIDRYLQANAAHPRIAVESNSVGCLLATLRGGGLATIMPQAAASEITGLKAIQLLPPIASRTVSVLQRDGAYRTAASRAFVRMLEARDWASLRGGPPAAA